LENIQSALTPTIRDFAGRDIGRHRHPHPAPDENFNAEGLRSLRIGI